MSKKEKKVFCGFLPKKAKIDVFIKTLFFIS
jgi:hypothetical protein